MTTTTTNLDDETQSLNALEDIAETFFSHGLGLECDDQFFPHAALKYAIKRGWLVQKRPVLFTYKTLGGGTRTVETGVVTLTSAGREALEDCCLDFGLNSPRANINDGKVTP